MDLCRKRLILKCREYFLGKFYSFIFLILVNLIIKIPSLTCSNYDRDTTFFHHLFYNFLYKE